MTMTSVIVPTFDSQFRNGLNEYDIRVNAPTRPGLSIPDSVRSRIVREIPMPTRPYRGEVTAQGITTKDEYVPLYSLSRAQLAAGPFQLVGREKSLQERC